jgi:hypothetical protein
MGFGVDFPSRRKARRFAVQGSEGRAMTPLDGFLVIAGFALGCRPLIEWLTRRRSPGLGRRHSRLAPSPWI